MMWVPWKTITFHLKTKIKSQRSFSGSRMPAVGSAHCRQKPFVDVELIVAMAQLICGFLFSVVVFFDFCNCYDSVRQIVAYKDHLENDGWCWIGGKNLSRPTTGFPVLRKVSLDTFSKADCTDHGDALCQCFVQWFIFLCLYVLVRDLTPCLADCWLLLWYFSVSAFLVSLLSHCYCLTQAVFPPRRSHVIQIRQLHFMGLWQAWTYASLDIARALSMSVHGYLKTGDVPVDSWCLNHTW